MRRFVLLLTGVLVVVLGVSALATWRALQARDELTAANSMVSAIQTDLRDGDLDAARAALPALRQRLERASSRVQGQSSDVAVHLPVLGRNLDAVRRAAEVGRLLGQEALPPLVAALDVVEQGRPLRDDTVDLAVLRQIGDHLRAASRATERAGAVLRQRQEPLLSQIEVKLQEAGAKVAELDASLQTATRAVDLAPAMLGSEGARTYFVAVQNNAEARATGGLVGAFALVRADHGKIELVRTGTTEDLRSTASPVASSAGAAETWQDIGSTRAWFDANLTPHFPDAARNLAGLWQRQTGQPIDGVLGLDPIVMSELLKAGGPIRLKDGSSIDAGNVVDFVMHREYVDYPDTKVRKQLLTELAAEVFHQVVAAKDPVATLEALQRSSRTGHLFLWSRHPSEQTVLQGGIVGGALPAEDVPYLQLLTQNFGGNKLDYYLRRTVTVTRLPDAKLNVELVLRNVAPLGLPPYMTVRSDRPEPPVPYGQASVGLAVYGALSTQVHSISVDGVPTVLQADRDHGHYLGTTTLELPRERTVRVSIVLTEPAGELLYRQQPLVLPDTLTINVPHRVVGR